MPRKEVRSSEKGEEKGGKKHKKGSEAEVARTQREVRRRKHEMEAPRSNHTEMQEKEHCELTLSEPEKRTKSRSIRLHILRGGQI